MRCITVKNASLAAVTPVTLAVFRPGRGPRGTISQSTASTSSASANVNDDAPRDAQLVEAALAGDRDAFGDLVTRYQDRLFNSLLRAGQSHEDAADAVQDAFVQAYTKLESFRGDSQFYTWLYRIARNVALSRQRRRRPMASVDHAKESAGDEPLDAGEGPEDVVLSKERVEHVQAALADLGDEHRQILVLREIEGCAYEEIAEILDLPVGTVRSRIFRARVQLKEKLTSLQGEEAERVG
jgi:RNA polymerase sigma-70 factor (ECF subfamily)